jgi:hypothetical protein
MGIILAGRLDEINMSVFIVHSLGTLLLVPSQL